MGSKIKSSSCEALALKARATLADLCPSCTQDCRHRLLILDSQIESFRQLEARLDERMTVLDEILVKLGALIKIDSLALKIIQHTGEDNETDRFARRLRIE